MSSLSAAASQVRIYIKKSPLKSRSTSSFAEYQCLPADQCFLTAPILVPSETIPSKNLPIQTHYLPLQFLGRPGAV